MSLKPLSRGFLGTLRFRVSALMIFVFLMAGLFGWLTHYARVQQRAVAAIVRSGGHVSYAGDWSKVQSSSSVHFKAGLLALIGIDYLSHVLEVNVDHFATDAVLEHIGRLSMVRRLNVRGPFITSNGVDYLRQLNNLDQLYFELTPISGERYLSLERRIARLPYDGDWNANALAIPYFMIECRKKSGLNIYYQGGLRLSDPELIFQTLLYMHGKTSFSLGTKEKLILRRRLDPGFGLLFADAACGSDQFDAAFRALAAELFPSNPLVPILPDDEFYSTDVGEDVSEVQYTHAAGGGRGFPRLEGVKLKGRWAIIYSKYGIGCALARNHEAICKGYTYPNSVKIVSRILNPRQNSVHKN